jgi:hypothetical protein
MDLISLNVSVIKFILTALLIIIIDYDMVEANQRNMNIDLHIKSLTIKVTEHTPVYVAWQRGKHRHDFP